MKKILFLVAALLVACGDFELSEEDLQKSENQVLNIDNALTIKLLNDSARLGDTVTVVGYMVGYVKTTNMKSATFDLPTDKINSNVLLADADTVKIAAECAPLALEKGEVRDSLNFYDNPQLLGQKIAVRGKVESYFGAKGIKKIIQMRWLETDSVKNYQNLEQPNINFH